MKNNKRKLLLQTFSEYRNLAHMDKTFSLYLSSVLWFLDSDQKLFLPLSIPGKPKGLWYYKNDTIVPNINIWKDSEDFLWRKKTLIQNSCFPITMLGLCCANIAYAIYFKAKLMISSHAVLSLTGKC